MSAWHAPPQPTHFWRAGHGIRAVRQRSACRRAGRAGRQQRRELMLHRDADHATHQHAMNATAAAAFPPAAASPSPPTAGERTLASLAAALSHDDSLWSSKLTLLNRALAATDAAAGCASVCVRLSELLVDLYAPMIAEATECINGEESDMRSTQERSAAGDASKQRANRTNADVSLPSLPLSAPLLSLFFVPVRRVYSVSWRTWRRDRVHAQRRRRALCCCTFCRGCWACPCRLIRSSPKWDAQHSDSLSAGWMRRSLDARHR